MPTFYAASETTINKPLGGILSSTNENLLDCSELSSFRRRHANVVDVINCYVDRSPCPKYFNTMPLGVVDCYVRQLQDKNVVEVVGQFSIDNLWREQTRKSCQCDNKKGI